MSGIQDYPDGWTGKGWSEPGRLARALGIPKVVAIGIVAVLIDAASQRPHPGYIDDATDAEIEEWCEWSGERGALARAVRATLLEGDGMLVLWPRVRGKLTRRRVQWRDSKRRQREREKEAKLSTDVTMTSEPVNRTQVESTNVPVALPLAPKTMASPGAGAARSGARAPRRAHANEDRPPEKSRPSLPCWDGAGAHAQAERERLQREREALRAKVPEDSMLNPERNRAMIPRAVSGPCA